MAIFTCSTLKDPGFICAAAITLSPAPSAPPPRPMLIIIRSITGPRTQLIPHPEGRAVFRLALAPLGLGVPFGRLGTALLVAVAMNAGYRQEIETTNEFARIKF